MKKRQTVIQKLLSPIASALSGLVGGYTATDPRRKLLGNAIMANRASANTLLSSAGPALRSHCRNLERNNPSARAAVEAVTSLVVGTGIALEPDLGSDYKNKRVRDIFNAWMAQIGVDGCDIYRLQSLAMREVVVAGEALWRVVPGEGIIPLRVLPLESEWLSDTEGRAPQSGCTLVSGLELDRYGQPVAYYLAPPEMGDPERVSATSMVHIFERRRPLQARGEPWFAPVIETLMNERDLVDTELYAAKQTAAMALVITSEAHDTLDTDEDGDSDDPAQPVRLGAAARLYPGEDIKAFGHTRPSQQIAPFRQMLRGDLAAACRIPVRFLDRDVSRANYSSMRADMIDTDRLLSPVREWVGHQSIGRLYQLAAPMISAMVGFPVDPVKYRLLPDGQPYVDPMKDVQASALAIEKGLSTAEAEISKKGGDYRQVWAQLAKENTERKQAGIGPAIPQPAPAPEPEDDEDDDAEDETEDDQATEAERHRRALELARAAAPVLPAPAPQTIIVRAEMPQQPAPTVTVEGAQITVPPAQVTVREATPQPAPVVNVTVPDQPAPTVNVNVPQQAAPSVTVAAPVVNIDNTVEVPQRTVIARPRPDGSVEMRPEGE